MKVIVVGAGVIGAAIADGLARRGADVTVLDMRGPGRGASWASAGLLAPYTEAHGESHLLRMGVRSLAMFDDFISAARDASGREIEYARTGTLEVALTEDDVARLLAMQAWLDMIDVRTEWLEGVATRTFEPAISPRVRAGLFIGEHGFVGVPSLVLALTASAEAAGAVFEAPVEALEVVPAAGGVTVRAGDRLYSGDHAVVAAGCWSGRVRVAGTPALPVRPVRGQLLHLEWRAMPAPTRPVWSHGCYTVPWADGTVLVGATVEEVGFDESTTASAIETLKSAATAILPAASNAALIETRVGLRPATLDGLPFIGAADTSPRVTFATGHFRNGILLAPLTATMTVAAILDDATDAMMSWTSPNRLTSITRED
jgi:glycine oxidase